MSNPVFDMENAINEARALTELLVSYVHYTSEMGQPANCSGQFSAGVIHLRCGVMGRLDAAFEAMLEERLDIKVRPQAGGRPT